MAVNVLIRKYFKFGHNFAVKVKPVHYYNQLVKNEIATVNLEIHIQHTDTLCGHNTCSPYIPTLFYLTNLISISFRLFHVTAGSAELASLSVWR